MAKSDASSLADATRLSFPPGMYRVVATVEHGDAGYALFDTNPTGQPYLYGVEYSRTVDGWKEGSSGNGPGWFGIAKDTPIGSMTTWGDAPRGADQVRAEFEGRVQEQAVTSGAYFVVWLDIPFSDAWPIVRAFRINGRWVEQSS
jgi:hypothetical protein